MEQYLLNLTSAFVGAITGAYAAIRINSANRRIAVIEKMLALVNPIGFKSWWKPEDGKPALIFHENYSELLGAYSALRAALPWWNRKGLIRQEKKRSKGVASSHQDRMQKRQSIFGCSNRWSTRPQARKHRRRTL